MKYSRIIAVLTIIAVTSAILVLMTSVERSFAQNDNATAANQSNSAMNSTAMSDQTGSGSISAWGRGIG
jgi:hypothetical protein